MTSIKERVAEAMENEGRKIQLDIIDGNSPSPESVSMLYAKAIFRDAVKPEVQKLVDTLEEIAVDNRYWSADAAKIWQEKCKQAIANLPEEFR